MYGIQGFRNYPNGLRMQGALQYIREKAPRTALGFTSWCSLFAIYDCTMLYFRPNPTGHDSINSIVAGALAGSTLAARSGPKQMIIQGIIGGVLLGLFETLPYIIQKPWEYVSHKKLELQKAMKSQKNLEEE